MKRPSWWIQAKLLFRTLFYNEHLSLDYAADTMLAPMFWCVDMAAGKLGAVFLTGVVILNAGVVFLTYCLGLPYWWSRNKLACVLLVVLGHWILANVVFHLYKAATTPPGYPPTNAKLPESVSVCKKCIAPKPPRAHHCSVCNRCVLKMDHHCPWMNNCIGHANRRYFFSYMVSVCIGLLYVLIFGWNIIVAVITMPVGGSAADAQDLNLPGDEPVLGDNQELSDPHLSHMPKSAKLRSVIVFYGFCCGGGMLMLAGLAFWHGKLISRGETSIEAHINKTEKKRLATVGKEFRNPYDFGWRENWKDFLGFHDWKTFLSRVVFPSAHAPAGNGLTWPTIYRKPSSRSIPMHADTRGVSNKKSDPRDILRSDDEDPSEALVRFHSEFELVKRKL